MKSPSTLVFGTAGIPLSTSERNTANGVSRVRELGLGCMELEFVHSINVTPEKAPEIKARAEKESVVLTCHAPYFINLNSAEPAKKHASMLRIEKSAEMLSMCGGWSVCFHPGFYQKDTKESAYARIRDNMKEIRRKLDEKGTDVWLRPETTGKETQFGDYIELLKISEDIGKVMPVFDFSHIHARSNGRYNSKEEIRQILSDIENYLGKEGLNNMHIHISGIAYGEKGEKNHLVLEESDLNYMEIIRALKEFRAKGVVICESPNIEEDALLLQKVYNNL